MKNMKTPTALITGAGSGIGLAAAQKFLAEGWNVIAIGRRKTPLDVLLKQHGSLRVFPFACDLINADEVTNFAKVLSSDLDFGNSLSAVINNAGVFERGSFKESSDSLWETMFNTNLLGSVRLTRAVLPLLEKNSGAIVNISSTLGLRPVSGTGAYSALKAAMINWTECLAIELSAAGIRANCICPGIIDTPIHNFQIQTQQEREKLNHLQPLNRIGRPEDVAYVIWSLCAPGSEWITGTTVKVDGGIHLV